MVEDEGDEGIEACRRLLGEYALAVDAGDVAAVTSLFAPGGLVVRGGERFAVPEGIAKLLGVRPAGLLMRHHLTTTRVRLAGEAEAEALSYYLLYRGEGEPPLPVSAPFSSGDWITRFVRTEAGWKIASLEIRRLFTAAAGHAPKAP